MFLGTNVGSVDMVKYAKMNGAYTIVTDYLPVEKSPAKSYSDEYAMINTADVDALVNFAKQHNVNAVFAGVSEFNLLRAYEISKILHLPFYFNLEQWNIIENKQYFRNLCNKFGVPTPKTYFAGEVSDVSNISIDEYPIVVKPVDASSSMGVNICKSEDTLHLAIEEALSFSTSKQIIIEQFFEGNEFSAHYTITNGEVSLSCVDERHPVAVNMGDVTSIPIARIYPSSFINEYIFQVNDQVISLIKSIGLTVGVVFVQGLYNINNNSFAIFEAGLRSSGEAPCRFLEKIVGINYMNNIVDYLLTSKVDIKGHDDPNLGNKKCATISFVSKGGQVNKIVGVNNLDYDELGIIAFEQRYNAGDIIPMTNTLRQIVLRFVLIAESIWQLKHSIDIINENVHVLGMDDKEMCFKFDTNNIVS